ncbi:hypothetical protein ABES03_02810 [Neobacillus rhizosphaerae]
MWGWEYGILFDCAGSDIDEMGSYVGWVGAVFYLIIMITGS